MERCWQFLSRHKLLPEQGQIQRAFKLRPFIHIVSTSLSGSFNVVIVLSIRTCGRLILKKTI